MTIDPYDARTAILAQVNSAENLDLTIGSVTFSLPSRATGTLPVKNTVVRLIPAISSGYSGTKTVRYDRIHKSQLGSLTITKTTETRYAHVLAKINSKYGTYLTLTDIIDQPLPSSPPGETTIDLPINPTSYLYYDGAVIPTLSSDPNIPTNAIAPTVWNSFAKHTSIFIDESGRNFDADPGAGSVLSAFGASSSVYYWEVVNVSPDSRVGIAVSTVPYSGYPGGNTSSWGLDTFEGKLYHNGIEVLDLSEHVLLMGTKPIGFWLDMDTNTLDLILEDGLRIETGLEIPSGPVYAIGGNTPGGLAISGLHANFGQEVFTNIIPYTARPGLGIGGNILNYPNGWIISQNCRDFDLVATKADGFGGSYEDVVEYNSFVCGFVVSLTATIVPRYSIFNRAVITGEAHDPVVMEYQLTNVLTSDISVIHTVNHITTTSDAISSVDFSMDGVTYSSVPGGGFITIPAGSKALFVKIEFNDAGTETMTKKFTTTLSKSGTQPLIDNTSAIVSLVNLTGYTPLVGYADAVSGVEHRFGASCTIFDTDGAEAVSNDGLTVTPKANNHVKLKHGTSESDGTLYVEFTSFHLGLDIGIALPGSDSSDTLGYTENSWGMRLGTGRFYHKNAEISIGSVADFSTTSVIGMLIKNVEKQIVFYKDGVVYKTITLDYPTSSRIHVAVGNYTSESTRMITINTGNKAFAYTPPNPLVTKSFMGDVDSLEVYFFSEDTPDDGDPFDDYWGVLPVTTSSSGEYSTAEGGMVFTVPDDEDRYFITDTSMTGFYDGEGSFDIVLKHTDSEYAQLSHTYPTRDIQFILYPILYPTDESSPPISCKITYRTELNDSQTSEAGEAGNTDNVDIDAFNIVNTSVLSPTATVALRDGINVYSFVVRNTATGKRVSVIQNNRILSTFHLTSIPPETELGILVGFGNFGNFNFYGYSTTAWGSKFRGIETPETLTVTPNTSPITLVAGTPQELTYTVTTPLIDARYKVALSFPTGVSPSHVTTEYSIDTGSSTYLPLPIGGVIEMPRDGTGFMLRFSLSNTPTYAPSDNFVVTVTPYQSLLYIDDVALVTTFDAENT